MERDSALRWICGMEAEEERRLGVKTEHWELTVNSGSGKAEYLLPTSKAVRETQQKLLELQG